MLDPFEARAAIAPPPTTQGTRLEFVAIVGPGEVQGAADNDAWTPAGYIGEPGGIAPVLMVEGHPVALPDAGLAARLAAIEARLDALEV